MSAALLGLSFAGPQITVEGDTFTLWDSSLPQQVLLQARVEPFSEDLVRAALSGATWMIVVQAMSQQQPVSMIWAAGGGLPCSLVQGPDGTAIMNRWICQMV